MGRSRIDLKRKPDVSTIDKQSVKRSLTPHFKESWKLESIREQPAESDHYVKLPVRLVHFGVVAVVRYHDVPASSRDISRLS